MNNIELDLQMATLVKSERKITREILELIVAAEHQRLPEERGFKDTYDWLIRGHGYSGGAANRRIKAARLLRDIPEVASKIQEGSLNLTLLWQAQKTMQAQQRASGQKITLEEKRCAIHKIENKTTNEAERELHSLFPDGVVVAERTTHNRDGGMGIFIQLTAEEAKELERSRELLSHALPGAGLGQVVARLAKEFNDHVDPLRKAPGVATPRRGATRRELIQRAAGQCVYRDPVTGRVCESRYQLELDHIIPKAKGGSDDPRNFRCYCRKHNQWAAEVQFGFEFMKQRRSTS